jgi:hypothetical protein
MKGICAARLAGSMFVPAARSAHLHGVERMARVNVFGLFDFDAARRARARSLQIDCIPLLITTAEAAARAIGLRNGAIGGGRFGRTKLGRKRE